MICVSLGILKKHTSLKQNDFAANKCIIYGLGD